MPQRLRALASLAEDLSPLLSTHVWAAPHSPHLSQGALVWAGTLERGAGIPQHKGQGSGGGGWTFGNLPAWRPAENQNEPVGSGPGDPCE